MFSLYVEGYVALRPKTTCGVHLASLCVRCKGITQGLSQHSTALSEHTDMTRVTTTDVHSTEPCIAALPPPVFFCPRTKR